MDQYTPVELERFERRDPLKKFSEKVAIQKTLGDKRSIESSPIRKHSVVSNISQSTGKPTGPKKQSLTRARSANKLRSSAVLNVSKLDSSGELALRGQQTQKNVEKSHNFVPSKASLAAIEAEL